MTDTTPRPWDLLEVDRDGFAITSQVVHTNSQGGTWKQYVAQMIPNSADAALIVTAVNAHEDLVKALELIFHHIPLETSEQVRETAEQVGWHETYKFEAAIDFARSALAKAKGEKT